MRRDSSDSIQHQLDRFKKFLPKLERNYMAQDRIDKQIPRIDRFQDYNLESDIDQFRGNLKPESFQE